MSPTVRRWLDREKAREKELRKASERGNHSIMLLLLVFMPVLVFIIGIVCGGAFLAALGNMKYGLIFALVIDGLIFLGEKLSPLRGHAKAMEYHLKQLDSEGEQDEFATQMLGEYGEGTVKCIFWKHSIFEVTNGGAPVRFRAGLCNQIWVTRDYVLTVQPGGASSLTRLHLLESIDVDTRYERGLNTWTHRYYIIFHEKGQPGMAGKTGESKEQRLSFPNSRVRDQLVETIQQLRSGLSP